MIFTLHKNKKLSYYRKTPVYIGEKNFDKIEVLLPDKVDNNSTSELNFVVHLINKNGDFLKKNLTVELTEKDLVGSIVVTADLTAVAQTFDLYIEMLGNNGDVIGKTNTLKVDINPLPDEQDEIIPKEEYEEIIDELAEIIQENTEAMNRINEFEDGKSAYEIAVEHGYEGTEEEWLASLVGATGAQGAKGDKGDKGAAGADGQIASWGHIQTSDRTLGTLGEQLMDVWIVGDTCVRRVRFGAGAGNALLSSVINV